VITIISIILQICNTLKIREDIIRIE